MTGASPRRSSRFGWLRSSQITALAVMGVGLVVATGYRPDLQPIFGDRAYLLYMGQAVTRGELLYADTSFGYPPLGPLLSAASMLVAKPLGVSSYLAPRFLSLVVASLSAVLLYVAALRFTRSVWAGLLAAMFFLSFDFTGMLAATNLEPKLLAQLLWLAAAVACQRRQWGVVGVASGAAFSAWQPAALGSLVMAVICARETRGRSWVGLRRFLGGYGLGVLPAVIYVTLTAQWATFIGQAFIFKLQPRPALIHQNLWHPMVVVGQAFRGPEQPVLVLAAFGFAVYLVRWFRRRRTAQASSWLHPRTGGLALLTGAGLLYVVLAGISPIEYLGIFDIVPFFSLIGFWAAWVCWLAAVRASRRARSAPGSRGVRRLTDSLLPTLTLLVTVWALHDSFRFEPGASLATQEKVLLSRVPTDLPAGAALFLGAEELYVLTERPSRWPLLRVSGYFLELLRWKEGTTCRALVKDLQRHPPLVVVIGPANEGHRRCLHRIKSLLGKSYERSEISVEAIGFTRWGAPPDCTGLTLPWSTDSLGDFVPSLRRWLGRCLGRALARIRGTFHQTIVRRYRIYERGESPFRMLQSSPASRRGKQKGIGETEGR